MVSITIHEAGAVLYARNSKGQESEIFVSGNYVGYNRDQRELALLNAALCRFNRPSNIDIYSGPYVYGVLKNDWIRDWAANGWLNKKGKEIRYKRQWTQIWEKLSKHKYTAHLATRLEE